MKPGLYANIHAKRKRIKAGSGEKMRQVGSQGAPTQQSFIDSAKTAKRAGGGMMDIDRMTAPLGYALGGPAGKVGRPTLAPELYEGFEPIHTGYAEAVANINNPEYARKWNMTKPRQPGLDEQLMQDYEPPIPRWGKAKELGKKGLEGIKGLGSKSLGALKYAVEELIGAGAAEGSESYISPDEAKGMEKDELEKEIYGFNPYEFGGGGYSYKNLRTIQIVIDELMSRLLKKEDN